MAKKYDIAFSFAGEDRDYVSQVAELLRNNGIKIFYDDYEKVGLWGKNLYDHLSEIYSNKTKYVIIFASKYYANKVWTNHERKSAQARALLEHRDFILPAKFDDTEIPGIPHTVSYIDLNYVSPSEFVALILEKLSINVNEFNPAQVFFFRRQRYLTHAFYPVIPFLGTNYNYRSMEILIDGRQVESILANEVKKVNLSPGHHYICIKYSYEISIGPSHMPQERKIRKDKTIGANFIAGEKYYFNIKLIKPHLLTNAMSLYFQKSTKERFKKFILNNKINV